MLRLSSALRVGRVALFLSACSPEPTAPATEAILLRLQGRVTSAVDGSPVHGAAVILGRGGHFTLPRDLAQTSTDEKGDYAIEHSVFVLRGNCGASQLWIRVSAPGFKDKGGVESSLRPRCVETIQRIEVVLEP